jgi:hypothetical protein
MTGRKTNCRDCGQDVTWLTTNNGRRVLVDTEPDQVEGTVAIASIPTYGTEQLEVAIHLKDDERGQPLLQQAREGGVPLRTVHFATCPSKADQS